MIVRIYYELKMDDFCDLRSANRYEEQENYHIHIRRAVRPITVRLALDGTEPVWVAGKLRIVHTTVLCQTVEIHI